MKRVLQVIGQLGRGGDTSVVLDIMHNMDKNKYHFDFLTHDKADDNVVQQLQNEGCTVYKLDGDVRKLGPIKYYNAVRNILRNSQYKYDIVHTHTSMQSGVALMAAKHEHIKKRVCHSHISAIQRETNKLSKFFLTPILRFLYLYYSTDKIGCSKMAGDFLFGNDNYNLIYNGVDTEKYKSVTYENIQKFRKEFNINDDDILIGHIARFSNMKNQDFDLLLAERLQDYPNIRFVLVGKGINFEKIKNKAKNLGDKIIFTGQRDDIPILMKSFDCVILPSLSGEGFPVTIMEAQAAGCKCIISDKVTSEVEVGLNLVKMIPTSNVEQWLDELKTIKRNLDIDKRNQYANLLEDKGFGKKKFVEDWLSFYL